MVKIESVETLLRIPINWKKEDAPASWVAEVDGETCHLRMNDFPDEPLYTVIFRGQAADLDDPPSDWTIPRY